MANYLTTDTDLTAVADAIRTKGGTSASLAFPAGFVSAIGNIPSGGGSSIFTLLDTITVPSDTRAVNLDFSEYQSYDFFFVIADGVTLSAADWLYMVKNGSSASGGDYTNKLSSYDGFLCAQISNYMGNPTGVSFVLGVRYMAQSANAATNLYIYCYNANTTIKAGSKFKVYGGNYVDM